MDVELPELDMVTGFVILLVVFLVTLVGFLVVSGLFTSVEVKTKEPLYGPMVIAYKTEIGPYRNAGELYTESHCLLPDREQIGIYYDDPEAVPENELRYAVGPILSNNDEPPSSTEMEKMRANGFKIAHFPKSNYVVTTSLPFGTFLSIYIAIYKAYPAMKAYIFGKSLCAYPAIEIYTAQDIIFMMPLSQQDEFYVREFQEEEISIATTDMGSVYNDNTDNESRDSKTPHMEERPRRDSSGFAIPFTPKKVSGLCSPSESNRSLSVTEILEEQIRSGRSRSPTREIRVSGSSKLVEYSPSPPLSIVEYSPSPEKDVEEEVVALDTGDTTPDDETSEGTTSSFEDIGKELDVEAEKA